MSLYSSPSQTEKATDLASMPIRVTGSILEMGVAQNEVSGFT